MIIDENAEWVIRYRAMKAKQLERDKKAILKNAASAKLKESKPALAVESHPVIEKNHRTDLGKKIPNITISPYRDAFFSILTPITERTGLNEKQIRHRSSAPVFVNGMTSAERSMIRVEAMALLYEQGVIPKITIARAFGLADATSLTYFIRRYNQAHGKSLCGFGTLDNPTDGRSWKNRGIFDAISDDVKSGLTNMELKKLHPSFSPSSVAATASQIRKANGLQYEPTFESKIEEQRCFSRRIAIEARKRGYANSVEMTKLLLTNALRLGKLDELLEA